MTGFVWGFPFLVLLFIPILLQILFQSFERSILWANGDYMSEGNIFDLIFKTIWGISLLNILFLVSLIFVAEYISGEVILHDSIEPSKDIEENIMFDKDETVTIIFKAKAVTGSERNPANNEVLNISLIDSQNKEFFWEKTFTAATDGKTSSLSKKVDSFSFTPESSGIHRIRISNANFETDVKLVSGMIMVDKQPLFWKTLIASCSVAFLGIFLVRGSNSKKFARSASGIISSSISLAISLLIVFTVVFKPI